MSAHAPHPLAAVLGAIQLAAGLVDTRGDLVAVNRGWTGSRAPAASVQPGTGAGYVTRLETSKLPGTADIAQIVRDALETSPRRDAAASVETTVPTATGETAWKTSVASAGEGLLLITHEDVSAQRRTDRELRTSRARLRTILTGAPLALFAVDAGGRFSMIEGMAVDAAGLITPDMAGKRVDVVHQHLPEFVRAVQSALAGATAVTTVEVGSLSYEVHVSADLAPDGRSRGAVGVATDVTERVRVQRLKDDFVSVVNHELRTPLTSIHGALSLLENGVAGELTPDAVELTTIARTSVDRLIRLISDLLDLDRIDSGRLELRRGRFDLAELAEDAVRELAAFAADAEVTVDTQALQSQMVDGDRDRLHQVLTNLLSNAIKFSPPRAAVTVSLQAGARAIRLSVTDRGPGIPLADQPRLFQKFSQLAPAGQDPRRGSGLGLAISKSIAEAHGGAISLHSEVGRGSTFHLELPAPPPVASTARFVPPAPQTPRPPPAETRADLMLDDPPQPPDLLDALKSLFDVAGGVDARGVLRDAHGTVQLLLASDGHASRSRAAVALTALRTAIERELDRAARGEAVILSALADKATETHAVVRAARDGDA